MHVDIKVEEFNVGGIKIQARSLSSFPGSGNLPVTVFFLLHGRQDSQKDVFYLAEATLNHVKDQVECGATPAKELVVVTFDHRNHGERLVDPVGNDGWDKDSKKNNPRHAIDMYSIQAGTSADVSFLIDYIPPYLYPNDEKKITTWAVSGVSLGGHSSWICLHNDPRVTIGIPVIGCPDNIALMAPRAESYGFKLEPPIFPNSLRSFIEKNDPASANYTSTDPNINPYIGKKILVMSGAIDPLVPWYASKKFVDGLYVGEDGIKEVFVQEGSGHKCTREMTKKMAVFMWEWGVKGTGDNAKY